MSKRLLLAIFIAESLIAGALTAVAQTPQETFQASRALNADRTIEFFSGAEDAGTRNLARAFEELFLQTEAARSAGANDELWRLAPLIEEGAERDLDQFVVGEGASKTTQFRDVVLLVKTNVTVDFDPNIEALSNFIEAKLSAKEWHAFPSGFCTGVFVSDATILTAAHCVCSLNLRSETGRRTTLSLWGFDFREAKVLNDFPYNFSPLDATAEPLLYDPIFCERLASSGQVETPDIALLHLDATVGKVRRSDSRTYARVTEFAWPTLYLSGELRKMTVVGYGFNDLDGVGFAAKVAAEVPVADAYCHFARVLALVGCRPGGEIVLIDTVFGNDSCNGDSGGPAYIKYFDRYYLAGITSRGAIPGAGCGSGGIYTLLTPQLQAWVRKNARNFRTGL